MDDILKKYGLKYEDLNPTEKETLNTWVNTLQQAQLTTDKIKDYIHTMKEGVELELTKIGHENKQDIYLKARLRNYILLEAFLLTPEKAQKMIDKSIGGIKK